MFTFFPTYALDLGVRWVGLFAVTYSVAALGVRAAAGGLADSYRAPGGDHPRALAIQAAATVLLAGLGRSRGGLSLPAGPFLASPACSRARRTASCIRRSRRSWST